ncbi:MAG: demethoxyubiquinone hydroxylase family protein [Rhodospirillaceae bacterium]|nr:demethoxyubiquinone hydroxylase family protein [Rhodospirillaceae bacterium]|tara:strand:- start:3531 stop:4097 length:567 start_codon:yes stop_codon:yes gene_type:complete
MTKPTQSKTVSRSLPGDQTKGTVVERMIRVDHAGEYGAVRIYEGQLAVLRGTEYESSIREMAEEEKRHRKGFEKLINERRIRPTVLSPLWHIAGFALGAGTALIGPKAAMACTEAVEEVIDEHYSEQASKLGDEERELRDMIEDFRQDELAHRDLAREEGSADAPGYTLLTAAVKASSRVAIWLSTRI